VEVEIHGLAADGAGVGRLADGRAFFVHRTAPGDRVRARVSQSRKRWGRGRLEEVLRPGPDRRPPPCPHYDRCGGCVLEHLAYPAQLQAKADRVFETLVRIGGRTDLPRVEPHPSPREFRYRNRASFALRRLAGGRVVAGFHELESPGRILDVGGECLLLEEGVARAWEGIREAWGDGAHRLPTGPRLRATVRGVVEGGAILLVEGGEEPGDPQALLEAVENLRAIWWIPGGGGAGSARGGASRKDAPRGGGKAKDGERASEEQAAPVLLAGVEEVEEEWFGERLPVRPGAFLQVNRWAAPYLHDVVLREMGSPRGTSVLDAYCGFGVYGRRMARHGAKAIGIEFSEEAVAMAEARPVLGFRVLQGRVEVRLAEALPVRRAVLNPPRQGAAAGVMEALARGVEERIVYVSCDPATLARDLAALGEAFRLDRIQVFDLFPQTAHVETVVTLNRAGGTPA
jgi:23S rRNA (uracil1939-C5)-methyltransferase